MQRDEGGVVWLDQARCVGCWMCVLGCPNGCVEPRPERHAPEKREGLRGGPAYRGMPLDTAEQTLTPEALAAEVGRRRSAFAASGWGWRGIDSYPAFRAEPLRRASPPVSDDCPRNYLLVGAGVATARAVEAIRSRDLAGSITVVSDEPVLPYSRVLLPKYVAGALGRDDLRLHERSWWEARRVTLVLGDGARALDPRGKRVLLASGRTLAYDRLLVATGAHGARPAIPGADLAGVETFHDLRSAEALRATRASRAVVVGGGFVAIKAAEALLARGAAVTMVVRSRLFRRSLDEQAAALVGAHLRAKGIDLREGTDLRALHGRDGTVRSAELLDGRQLDCELVVLGAGVKAAVEWLDGSGVALAGGVVADTSLRASVADVWVAGDVAITPDLLTGKMVANAIWPAASAQGRIAGANMAGEAMSYDGFATANTLDLLGLPVATFGDPALGERTVLRASDGLYEARYYRDGRLVGAVFVGDITGCGRLLAEASREALTIRR